MFKEKIGDFSAARTLVKQGLDLGSDFIGTVKKQANMEKRLGNTEVACQTYEKAIELAKENRNFDIIPSLYYNFAQFTFAASGSIDAARGVFIKGFQQAPCRAILEGLINFTTIHGGASEIPIIDVIIMNALEPGSSVFQALSDQDREDISSLFVEFVDLYGDIHDVRKAWDRHRKLFPHIMDLSANHASSENSTVNKSMNAGNGPGMDLVCNGCIVNSNLARDRKQTTNLPAQSSYDILEEVDVIGKLNLERNRTGTQEIQLTDAKIMEQSVKQSGSHNVANEQVDETNPQCSKIEDDREPNFDDLKRLPSLDNLSLKSPNVNNLPVISTTLIDSELSEEVITVVSSSKVQHGEDVVEASEVHVPVILDRKSSSSSHPDQYNESYSFQATGSPAIEAQLKFHQQFNPQSQSNSKPELPPNTIPSPQIASGGGSWAQNNKRKQNPEDATSPDGHIQIQVSEHQNCQVQEEAQYPLGGNSSQLPPDQFHPYQSQAWSNTQAPQASQTQVLYQMAAAQAYQTTNLAWTGQTMQHQGLVYVQPQPSSQPASQTQTYAYQQLNQNSQQYGYTQSGQVFNPQIWQYYQQQLYYLQQQQQQWQQQQQQQSQPQNQLTPNSSDLLSQDEQVQQQQEKKSQQMPTRSQQLVIQLQRKQNQKTNQQVHEHASSPEQRHNQPHQQQQQALQLQQQDEQANQTQHQQQQQALQLQQQDEQANQTQHQQQASQLQQQNGRANQTQHQQQASHIQQQNEQANQTQQQLLYLQHQQQQQQIYMQQQQLYLQQLYQQQLFQQQQQQVPQQLQQYQLFQLQQQLFQLQQQQQPTIGTSEVQVQQGEDSKSQKVEQPERSHSSTPQRTPTH